MRKLAVVLAGCLVLTGCSASWQQEVRYRIAELDTSNSPTEYFRLELVGDAPGGALAAEQLKLQLMQTSEIEGAQVGDEVLCAAEQEKGNAFGNSNVVTHLRKCRKA
ncbi:hypothetical protein ACFWN2_40745 [Lentzea sp. NPDC058436]|uniref:hypothetical protein n=1 Tax=Lentzea sp. NPDC058436 TaxID=3346499 RepID=UPI00364AA521